MPTATADRPRPERAPLEGPSVLDLIGNTPMVEMQRAARDLPRGVTIFAKLEGFNPDGSIRLCRTIYEAARDRYFKPDQYNNEANSGAHFRTTGPEIWQQTGGRITHFVAALGTTGTIMGTGRFLKSKRRDVTIVAVEP